MSGCLRFRLTWSRWLIGGCLGWGLMAAVVAAPPAGGPAAPVPPVPCAPGAAGCGPAPASLGEQVRGGITRHYDAMETQLEEARRVRDLEPARPAARADNVIDPTRTTSDFERMFYELSHGKIGASSGAGVAPPALKMPRISLLGHVRGDSGAGGTILLRVEEEMVKMRPGAQVTVLIGDKHVQLQLQRDKDGLQLQLGSPYNLIVNLF